MKRGTTKEQEWKETCERTEKDAKQVQFLNLSLSRQSNVGVVEKSFFLNLITHMILIKVIKILLNA